MSERLSSKLEALKTLREQAIDLGIGFNGIIETRFLKESGFLHDEKDIEKIKHSVIKEYVLLSGNDISPYVTHFLSEPVIFSEQSHLQISNSSSFNRCVEIYLTAKTHHPDDRIAIRWLHYFSLSDYSSSLTCTQDLIVKDGNQERAIGISLGFKPTREQMQIKDYPSLSNLLRIAKLEKSS